MSLEIRAAISEPAKIMKANLAVGDGGVIVAPKDFYAQFLSEGNTPKQVNAIAADRSNFIASASLAAGELADEAFKKDKKLNNVSVKLPFGDGRTADYVEINVARSKESRNPGTGEMSTNYNVLTQKFVAAGTKSSSSTMKAISSHLKALGAEANS